MRYSIYLIIIAAHGQFSAQAMQQTMITVPEKNELTKAIITGNVALIKNLKRTYGSIPQSRKAAFLTQINLPELCGLARMRHQILVNQEIESPSFFRWVKIPIAIGYVVKNGIDLNLITSPYSEALLCLTGISLCAGLSKYGYEVIASEMKSQQKRNAEIIYNHLNHMQKNMKKPALEIVRHT